MEEIEGKKLIIFQLENLIDLLNKTKSNKESIQQFKWFVDTVSADYKEEKGLYKKCIVDLLSIKYLEEDKYIYEATSICNYYYDRASGNIYDETLYINNYRKKHYKQLNVDVPISIMEDFEMFLKMTNQTKKQFIIKSINDFIRSMKK